MASPTTASASGFDVTLAAGTAGHINSNITIFNDASINGSTDEFRVYNTALTAAQVQASFAAGPTAVPEPLSAGLLGTALLGLMMRRLRTA